MPIVLTEAQQNRILLLFLCLVLTVIIVPKGGFVPDYYSPGDVASRDVKAPRNMMIPDEALTEKKRQEAREAVRPVYDFDAEVTAELGDRLIQALRIIDPLAEGEEPDPEIRQTLEDALDAGISDEEFSVLSRLPVSDDLLHDIRQVLNFSSVPMIVANRKVFLNDAEKGVVVRDLRSQQENTVGRSDEVIGMGDAQEMLRARLDSVEALSKREREVLFALTQRLLRPNLTFNKEETESRKTAAMASVTPVFFQVKKGEMIVREGERVNEEQIKKLRAMRDIGSDYSVLTMGFGLFLATLILVLVGHRFATRNIRKYRPNGRDLLFISLTFTGLFILIKLSIFVSTALESAFPYIESTSYYYAFPFAVGAMLVRLVLNSEIAFVFAALSSVLIGVLFGNSLVISGFALVSSVTGAHWVRHCKTRSTLYRAGMWISLVNVGTVVAIHFMAGRMVDIHLLHKMGFALAGGIVCAIIVNGTIPLIESVFKYTTDIKLLELANMNAPVLRELMVQAPGTYHHSIIVGNLAEAAAEEINANPLLARVAAYYHDIGKIRKPLYFIENTGNSANKHDKLAPSMSALILMAHVKDGVEIARENKLGEQLVDIIRQHHGTALIKFFYDKAKSKEDPGVQQVDERDYRYPGPRPQSREAALIMLADAVEAASRTLTEPTPARIQGMVQKIINNIFIDGQLNECELTLKDLNNIAKSFNRILAGIFHHRVDYPEPAYKERDKDGGKKKVIEDTNREPAKETKDREADPPKGGAEDLKRLGMS
ncbi:phosphohydrolase [Geoalkalibacter subterraneus]|uniref:Phosphohydrolase n=1 Tax=Geoalkalibacter subterraneus TaxID=483547 RepID=A0A0B5FUZ8_9BACT|nr:phosphohydrolase [Geoalkalibacter subterraneus]